MCQDTDYETNTVLPSQSFQPSWQFRQVINSYKHNDKKVQNAWDESSGEPNLIPEVRKSILDKMIFKLRSKGEYSLTR